MYWPFEMHPELAVACAALFFGSYAAARSLGVSSKWLLFTAGLWLAYAAWEQYCTAGNYNIRVDLIVIPIVMISVTVASLLTAAAQIGIKRKQQ